MFSLEDIKQVNRNYYLNDKNEICVQFRARSDSSITKPENLTQEEKSYIKAALYLKSLIRLSHNFIALDGKSDEQILQNAQTNFLKEALNSNSKVFGWDQLIRPTESLLIWESIAKNDELAIEYFKRTLSENGKDIKNLNAILDRKIDQRRISYELVEKARNSFIESLDPNNPMYTQPPKTQILTPEQKANRRAYVEKAIQYYNMMEHDEWYQHRVEKEDKNMQRVARIVNNHEQMMPVKNGPGLFYLLKAAQNLSIIGEKDFLEEILSQPEVNKTLLEFKASEQAKKMKAEAQENEKNGKVNADGLLSGHHMTYGERLHKEANEYISKHPNEVTFAKKELSEKSSFPLEYGNSELTKKSKVIELVARAQGKYTNRTRNSEGNIVLQVNDEKEQVK
mgnify:CR=1 FL=1